MNRIGAVRRWAILSGMLAGLLFLGSAWAQTGIVLDHPRVSCILFIDGRFVMIAPPSPGHGQDRALELVWADLSHPRTTIPFRLSAAADVRIDIWDLGGRRVRRLVGDGTPAGDHQMDWDGRDDGGLVLPNGTYFYRIAFNGRPVAGAGRALSLR
jgi:hypothetical protein